MSKLLKNSKGKKVGVGGVGGGGRLRHSTLPITTTTTIPPRNLNYNNQGYKGICAYASSSGSSGGWSESETAAAIMFNKGEGSSGQGRTKRIYTDWANHYLEKARSKRHITDLQVDVTDGVILADVVEAVTAQKIPDINRKPKTASQMLDNIQACLLFLTNLGVSLEGINSRDIRDGHLKSILSLFFQLSRFKQQQKQQDRDRHNLQRQGAELMMHTTAGLKNPSISLKDNSKLSSTFGLKPHHPQTSIPLPSSTNGPTCSSLYSTNSVGGGSVVKRLSQEKGKAPLTFSHHHNHIYSNPAGNVPVVKPATTSGSSSRSTSPSALGHSFIPTPRSSIPSAPSSCRSSLHEKHLNNAKNSSIAGPPSKSSVRTQNANSVNSASIHAANVTISSTVLSNGKNNSSMLEKFKFFKDKDKSADKLKSSTTSKRTSSSSGFSSARSERSDSSVSLCSDSKTGWVEGSEHNERDHNGSIIPQSSSVPTPSDLTSTPRLAIKGFRQKIGKAIASKESKGSSQQNQSSFSPKTSKKELLDNGAAKGPLPKKEPPQCLTTTSGKIKGGSGKESLGGGQGFLRQPKPSTNGNSSRDSRNRFSGTGIPTRNSLIASNNSNSRDDLQESVHSSMSSINGPNSTGIPKPTAAIKGTSKQPDSSKLSFSISKEALKDCVTQKSGKMDQPQSPHTDYTPKSSKVLRVGFGPNNKEQLNSLVVNGKGPSKPDLNSGITVAMIAPMPNSVSNSASVSSVESSSLSQSQLSSLSHSNSNSSEASVILNKGVIRQHSVGGAVMGVTQVQAVKEREFSTQLDISSGSGDNNVGVGSNSKVSPMSVCGASGSSSMGSLKCVVVESSSGASSSADCSNNGPGLNLSPNGNNEVIPECDEDDILLNVTPMEPLTYEYIKSPPSGHQTPGFLSPKSGMECGGRLGPCMNGNAAAGLGRILTHQFNPYGDAVKDVGRGSRGPRQYASSVGEHDYSEIDNFDINSGGYLSDGDLLTSNNGNHHHRISNNDGYLSESGTSLYPRRQNQGTYKKDIGNSSKSHQNNNKHGLIPEDSFDDSSSISSGISDLNEIPTDLTSSSVNSELSSPYASLQRGSGEGSVQQKHQINPQSIIYRVVGSRNRKSENKDLSISSNTKRNLEEISLNGSHESAGLIRSGGHPHQGASKHDGSNVSSSLGTGANKFVQYSLSSHKRSLNNLDLKGKKGMIGVKEDYYGSEVGERLTKEEEQDSYRNLTNLEGRQRGAAGKMSQNNVVNPNFGYVRRSTGCGIGGSSGGHSVSNTKYSIPVYGNGKVSLGGMKEMLTAEEFKAAHAALAMATGGQAPHHSNPYGVMNSPKTRTKVKVSGGTQTTNDLHDLRHHHPNQHESEYATSTSSRNSGSFSSRFDPMNGGGGAAAYKSLSLTAPTASQLSQSLRERILGSHSLPKGATSADYAALLAAIQQQQHHQQIYGTPNASKERMSRYLSCKTMNDGSLSDTGGYSNYAEIQAYALSAPGPNNGGGSGASPYSWMRHSTGYASSITSAPTRLMGGGSMTEAESMESIHSSVSQNIRDARSNTLNQVRSSGCHQRDASPTQSPRLNRSNSIRSTKSEKLYPSVMQRTEDAVQYYNSVLSGGGNDLSMSPVHGANIRLGGNASEISFSSTPSNSANVRLSMSPYSTGYIGKIPTKENEINASSLSLVSTSSMYSSQEDKQAHEVRKFKRDLMEAQDKVHTLTSQLSTNAHVVAAFEQSLSNMTQRIHSLTSSAEQKDSELMELKHTIDLLRKQSIEAGLTVASMHSGMSRDGSPIARQLSADSVSSINSISSACSCTSHSHSHTSSPSGQVQTTPLGTPTHTPSANCVPPDSPNLKKKHGKNKGWLRSSFTKAFSRSKSKPRNGYGGEEGYENEGNRRPSDLVDSGAPPSHLHHNGQQPSHKSHCLKLQHQLHQETPGSPLLSPPQSNGCSSSSGSHSPRSNSGTNASSGVCEDFGDENKSVDELKKQLREKEMVLTDIRLEALTSAHQLESLKETVNKMRNEMLNLKQDNERLQHIVTCKSLTSSQSSLQMVTQSDAIERRLSASEVTPPSTSNLDVLLCEALDKEGKRIVVTVFLGCHGSYERYTNTQEGFPAQECNIGTVSVSNKTKWDVLDAMIKRVFKEYLTRVDPISNLGLSADSILSYNVGEVLRSKEYSPPELLPCGYLVGDVNKIRVCLRGAIQNGSLDALAMETLVPKSILQRYITLLSDHGRIILCGPSGTGKSYLAKKIGEYLVARCGSNPCPEAIATFSADHKNSKELRQYLANLAEQCESGSADLPSVIILDNLHQVSSFGEVFSGYLNSKQSGGPVIIGTMTQSTASTPNIQLHHNFRWVLFGNHLEPVKGLLSRYLQRRLMEVEVQNGSKNVELAHVMEWIPKVWLHINKFLETHNSSEVTIGPRLFLSCPTDVANSQVWFTDLWHYSIVPYIMEAVKEGLQLYGRKAPWEDPCLFLLQTYPWPESHSINSGKSLLLRLRPEDVGYDSKSTQNFSSSHGKHSQQESNGDQDPLMNMLMRLQEAANYSGPHSSDLDGTSLESRASMDSKDFIATA